MTELNEGDRLQLLYLFLVGTLLVTAGLRARR